MRTVTVELGGKPYELKELSLKKGSSWRTALSDRFTDFAGVFEHIASAGDVDVTDGEALSQLLSGIARPLLGSIDLVFELVIQYDPEIKKLEDEVTPTEILACFVEMLRLAYPFDVILDKVKGLKDLLG